MHALVTVIIAVISIRFWHFGTKPFFENYAKEFASKKWALKNLTRAYSQASYHDTFTILPHLCEKVWQYETPQIQERYLKKKIHKFSHIRKNSCVWELAGNIGSSVSVGFLCIKNTVSI